MHLAKSSPVTLQYLEAVKCPHRPRVRLLGECPVELSSCSGCVGARLSRTGPLVMAHRPGQASLDRRQAGVTPGKAHSTSRRQRPNPIVLQQEIPKDVQVSCQQTSGPSRFSHSNS